MNRVLFLLGLSVLINYIDRSNLSIAAPLIKDELNLSGAQLGTLLAGFFYTYALLQIPAGWLVDRFDVKWVFGLGFLIWSVSTAVTGLLHGFVALLFARVVLGIGESVAFPAYGKIIGTHFQESRRGFANSIVITGLALGPALGMLIGGNVVGRFGWRPFFLVLGLAALFWLPPWWAWMPRSTSPPDRTPEPTGGVLAILLQPSAWGTCLCQFSFNYASYFLVTWLPFYLTRERHLSMSQMARVGGFVYLLFAVSATIFGKLSDRWVIALLAAALVASGHEFTALFCANDEMAVGALSYFQQAGIAVPAQVSVLGYDDTAREAASLQSAYGHMIGELTDLLAAMKQPSPPAYVQTAARRTVAAFEELKGRPMYILKQEPAPPAGLRLTAPPVPAASPVRLS